MKAARNGDSASSEPTFSVFFAPITPMEKPKPIYRTDRLPVIMPYHWRSNNALQPGDLVYYGPCPEYYGVGVIQQIVEHLCIVDFRGTGETGLHKDSLEKKYLIPIHKLGLSHLLKEV